MGLTTKYSIFSLNILSWSNAVLKAKDKIY